MPPPCRQLFLLPWQAPPCTGTTSCWPASRLPWGAVAALLLLASVELWLGAAFRSVIPTAACGASATRLTGWWSHPGDRQAADHRGHRRESLDLRHRSRHGGHAGLVPALPAAARLTGPGGLAPEGHAHFSGPTDGTASAHSWARVPDMSVPGRGTCSAPVPAQGMHFPHSTGRRAPHRHPVPAGRASMRHGCAVSGALGPRSPQATPYGITHSRSYAGFVCHRSPAPPTLMDTVVQSLRCLPDLDGLVIAESAVVLKGLPLSGLRQRLMAGTMRGNAGSWPESCPQSQSIIECMARFLLRRAGFHVESQVNVPGMGHLDLMVDGRLGIETDGAGFHMDRTSFEEDRRRWNVTTRLGIPTRGGHVHRWAGQPAGRRGARRGGGGGTSLAATTSSSAITTSARRVRTVHSPSDLPTSSPSASVSPPSIRYLTTTRVPSGAAERNCCGTGNGGLTRSS